MKLRPLIRFLATTRIPSLYATALRFRPGFNEETRCYLRLVRQGSCVVDVGANYGHYTVLFSQLAGRKGRVFAFEPVPKSVKELRRRLASEMVYDNVVVSELAVTETSGLELSIGIPNNDYGQASLTSHSHGSWGEGDRIEHVLCHTVTLDEYAAVNGLRRVDFIKIDVEGAELLVLRGAEQTLKTQRPIIHLEYFSEWAKAFDYSLADLVAFLKSCGYRWFYTEDLVTIENFHARFNEFNNSENFVCAAVPVRPRFG